MDPIMQLNKIIRPSVGADLSRLPLSAPGSGVADLSASPAHPFRFRLMSDSLDTFRPPHEIVEERTKQRREENNQRPGNLIIALRRFFGNTINKYPDPENCCEDSNAIKPS